MKSSLLAVVILFFLSSCNAQAVAIKKLEPSTTPDLVEPSIQIVDMQGIKLYHLADHDLPLVQMSLIFKGGHLREPIDQKGINQFMTLVMRTGGTQKYTPEKFDAQLELLSAEVSISVSSDRTMATIKCMKKDAATVLDLFFSMLKEPVFQDEKVELIRTQLLEEVRSRNERPLNIANREFTQQLYNGSDYFRMVSSDEILGMTRDELVNHHRQYIGPGNIISVGFAGDFELDELQGLLKPHFETWKVDVVEPEPVVKIEKEWEPSIHFIAKDFNQSAIVMGHFSDTRYNPEKYAIILANQILGGATFGAKLGNRIRAELGLVYSVVSAFDLESWYGRFRMVASTKAESTSEVFEEMKKILTTFSKGGISESELQFAKNLILNELIFQYEDPFEIVVNRMIYDYYGYPPGYLSLFQKAIKQTTLRQVRAAAKKYFLPHRLKVMVVGSSDVKEQLEAFGEVQDWPLDDF